MGKTSCPIMLKRTMILRLSVFLYISSCVAMPVTALARDRSAETSGKLTECRKITEPNQRLACYDMITDSIRAALEDGSIKIVDQKSKRETDQKTFGLMGIAGAADTDDRLREISSQISALSPESDGSWIITLANGTAWRAAGSPKGRVQANMSVTITRDQFGRYKMTAPDGHKTVVYRVR